MSVDTALQSFLTRLATAVKETMETDVADAAKDEIGRQLDKYDFPASRGPSGDGLLDRRNLSTRLFSVGDELHMTIEDVAYPQEKKAPAGELASAVTEGRKSWHMHKAGPRPFMQPAEKKMGEEEFADALKRGLAARGFQTD